MPSDPCLRLRLWEGATAAVFSGGCSPGKNPRPPHPTVIPGALRASRAAAGEGRGLAARGAHPQPVPRTPQTTARGADRKSGAGREEALPEGREGPGAGQGGGDLGAPVFSKTGAWGGVTVPTVAERPTLGG